MTETPPRPDGVPEGAVYFPPADTFAALKVHNDARPGGNRAYLRIHAPFAWWGMHGVMLVGVHHRALSVNRRTWSMGRMLVYSGDEQVPGVWAWSLADERAAAAP